MTKLYQLTGAYNAIFDDLADPETGEITESEQLDARLAEIEPQLDAKIIACAKMVRQFLADAKSLADEEHRIRERRKSIEQAAEGLKGYMLRNMEAVGKTKVRDPLFTVSIRAGREKVVIDDPEMVSDLYMRFKKEPNKEAIRNALKAGEEIRGARMGVGDASLLIK